MQQVFNSELERNDEKLELLLNEIKNQVLSYEMLLSNINQLYNYNINEYAIKFSNEIIREFYLFQYFENVVEKNQENSREKKITINESFNETKTSIRLANAAIEYNVSIETIKEILYKNGYNVNNIKSSTRVTEKMIKIIEANFEFDKKVKQKSQNIDLNTVYEKVKKKKKKNSQNFKSKIKKVNNKTTENKK